METNRLSKILGKCTKETVTALAGPILDKYPVTVVRKPQKTLVMVRMKETVAKADFYLGELLACEALVELEGCKGFALFAGDDTEKTLCAAVLDAVNKTNIPEKEEILKALAKEEEKQKKWEQEEIKKHAQSKVQFQTLDVEY